MSDSLQKVKSLSIFKEGDKRILSSKGRNHTSQSSSKTQFLYVVGKQILMNWWILDSRWPTWVLSCPWNCGPDVYPPRDVNGIGWSLVVQPTCVLWIWRILHPWSSFQAVHRESGVPQIPLIDFMPSYTQSKICVHTLNTKPVFSPVWIGLCQCCF